MTLEVSWGQVPGLVGRNIIYIHNILEVQRGFPSSVTLRPVMLLHVVPQVVGWLTILAILCPYCNCNYYTYFVLMGGVSVFMVQHVDSFTSIGGTCHEHLVPVSFSPQGNPSAS